MAEKTYEPMSNELLGILRREALARIPTSWSETLALLDEIDNLRERVEQLEDY